MNEKAQAPGKGPAANTTPLIYILPEILSARVLIFNAECEECGWVHTELTARAISQAAWEHHARHHEENNNRSHHGHCPLTHLWTTKGKYPASAKIKAQPYQNTCLDEKGQG